MSTDVESLSSSNTNQYVNGLEEAEPSVLDLLIVLAIRKRFLVKFTAAIFLISVITSLLLPTWYTATTVILPPQNNSSAAALLSQVNGLGALGALTGNALGIKNPSDLYVEMLRSRSVEDAMIQRFHLVAVYGKKKISDTRKKLESHSNIIASPKDGFIRISVEAKDPKLAADMTNGYVEELRRLSATLAVTEASQRRLFFEQQLSETKDKLAESEESLKHTQQNTGLIQLDGEARALIESAASLRAQLAAKQVQIETMRSYATEDNPDIVLAKQQVAALESQLAQLAGNRRGVASDPLLPRGDIPEAGLEYGRKLRDVKYYETMFQLLARQLELAKLDEAKQGNVIQVMDAAVPPDKRSFPQRTPIIVVATILGFLAAVGWILLTNWVSHALLNQTDQDRLARLKRLLWPGGAHLD
jgi:uncharacterized protein involved in exopolysaccharide biosynthesis